MLSKGERNAASLTAKQQVWQTRTRFERMRGLLDLDRQSFLSHWRDLSDFIQPRRGRFTTTDTNRGDRRSKKIIDSTGTFAARTLASGMMSGVTSPARPWFRLTVPDYALNEQSDVRQWLDEVADRMRKVLGRSNLYKVLPTCYGDLGVFGTHAMMCIEDDEKVVRFYAFPIGSYYLANDAKGQVRVFVREFRMTVRQCVERFGTRLPSNEIDWSNFSVSLRARWEANDRDQWVDVIHIIEPNDQWNPKKLHAKYKRFRSVYYERGVSKSSEMQASDVGDAFLEDKGFDEFPVFAPRWEVTGEDAYGTNCPGMLTLGDIMQLQHGEKKGMKALDKMIDPPLVGPMALTNAKVSLLPGDITYLSETSDAKLRAIHEVDLRVDYLENKQQQIRNRITRGMFADLFLMLDSLDDAGPTGQKTATEIQERHEEKLLALGPMLENLNQELLDPLIDRVFNIMLRGGLFPPPPEALHGSVFDVEYTSIMAQAQKAVGLGSLERVSAFAGNLATASQNPAVWDKLNTDEMIDEYADSAGIPSRLIVADDKVQAIRASRAQQAASQQAVALAGQASMAARNLAQSDTSQKNALTDLLGGTGSAAA